MKSLVTIFASILVVFSFLGCDSPEDKHDERMRQMKADHQKRMKEIDDMLNNPTFDPELFSAGGQPGDIKLSGALVKAGNQELSSQVFVYRTAGKGKDEQTPEVTSSIELSAQLKDSHSEAIESVADGEYLNFGCDPEDFDLGNLREKMQTDDFNDIDSVFMASAEVILMCDPEASDTLITSFNSKKLILSNLTLNIETILHTLMIYTKKLVLVGNNRIALKGLDSEMSSSNPAPNLDFSAAEILGQGKLQIHSSGSNYKKKAN